jgi:tetratricopeptide (TPR) repeat protein
MAVFRGKGDQWGIAWSLRGLGQIALDRGDYAKAMTAWGERLALSREVGNIGAVAHSLDYLAVAARMQGDYARSATLFEESLALRRASGDQQAIAWMLHAIGDLALARGDQAAAGRLYQEGLALRQQVGDQPGLATSLEGFAALAAACRQPRRALSLAGAADALHRVVDVPPSPVERATVEHWLAPAREELSVTDAAEAWAAGAAMPLEQVLASILSGPTLPGGQSTVDSPRPTSRRLLGITAGE